MGNSNVLVTKHSKLVTALFLETHHQIITLDTDYLLRVWDIASGTQLNTFLLKEQ